MRPVVPAPPLAAVCLHVVLGATSRGSSSALTPLAVSPAFRAEPRPSAAYRPRPCPAGLAASSQAWLGSAGATASCAC